MLHLLSPRFGRLGVCSRMGVEGRIRDRFAGVCISVIAEAINNANNIK